MDPDTAGASARMRRSDERVVTRVHLAGEVSETHPRTPGHVDRPCAAPVPDFSLQAPVELWFEDARIGVREDTLTLKEFRKYADALLTELRAARRTAP